MKPRLFAKGNSRTIQKLLNIRSQARRDKVPRVAQRIQGILHSLDRHSVNAIARLIHMQRSTVHSWIIAWNEYGADGLLEGHRSGRPSLLTPTQKERLYDIVESGPVAYRLDTGVWTSPVVSHVIEEEFNVTYHPGHVRKLLQQLGFSVQRPTTQLIRADKASQRKWIRYTYPNLKKKHAKKRR